MSGFAKARAVGLERKARFLRHARGFCGGLDRREVRTFGL